MAAAAVTAIGMDRHHAGGRFAPLRRLDLDRQPIFVAGPVDPDLVADHQRRQQRNRAEPFEIHLALAAPAHASCPLGTPDTPASNRRAFAGLIPARVLAKDWPEDILQEGINVTASADDRLQARNDLAWAISVGGIGIVLFAALLLFTWHFAATLFLIFAGMLLGVALNAMTNLLGRVVRLPHSLRLTIVCLVLAGMLSGIIFLGGATIAQQTTVLSNTIKSQLVNVKAFLERNGIDTSFFDFGTLSSPSDASAPAAPAPPPTHILSQRRHHCLERRRHLQPEPETDPRHRQRGRKLLYRAVSGTRLCGAAKRLPQRAVVHGTGQTSRARGRRSSTGSARRWSAG